VPLPLRLPLATFDPLSDVLDADPPADGLLTLPLLLPLPLPRVGFDPDADALLLLPLPLPLALPEAGALIPPLSLPLAAFDPLPDADAAKSPEADPLSGFPVCDTLSELPDEDFPSSFSS
jgi:hypothetical protein